MEDNGLVFDIDGEMNPGTWFDMEGGGRLCLRVCNGEAMQKIRKKVTKKRVEYKNGQRFSYEDPDEIQLARLLWNYCIPEWENLFSDKEKSIPIPCNIDTKNALMERSVKFAAFVDAKLEILGQIMTEEEGKEPEN